jgi:hypothetical protein
MQETGAQKKDFDLSAVASLSDDGAVRVRVSWRTRASVSLYTVTWGTGREIHVTPHRRLVIVTRNKVNNPLIHNKRLNLFLVFADGDG